MSTLKFSIAIGESSIISKYLDFLHCWLLILAKGKVKKHGRWSDKPVVIIADVLLVKLFQRLQKMLSIRVAELVDSLVGRVILYKNYLIQECQKSLIKGWLFEFNRFNLNSPAMITSELFLSNLFKILLKSSINSRQIQLL